MTGGKATRQHVPASGKEKNYACSSCIAFSAVGFRGQVDLGVELLLEVVVSPTDHPKSVFQNSHLQAPQGSSEISQKICLF